MSSGTLTVEHNFPKGSPARAAVDVKLLLQTLKTNQTDVGCWVNIIGYVTSIEQKLVKTTRGGSAPSIGVQALLVWTAVDLDISAYEKSLTLSVDL